MSMLNQDAARRLVAALGEANKQPALPVQHYTVPMTDERVRLIVREELARHPALWRAGGRMTPVGAGDGNTFAVG